MLRVTSLKSTIITQFAVILLPIIALLAYQTISETQRAQEVKSRFELHERAEQMREQFTKFLNGAADAVDSSRIGQSALDSLLVSADHMSVLSNRSDMRELQSTSETLTKIAKELTTDPSVTRLVTFRDQIDSARQVVASSVVRHARTLDSAILRSIDESRRIGKIVTICAFLIFALTLWFIYKMIKGLTQPLATAVRAADAIAEGKVIDIDDTPKRDIGNLLASLKRMYQRLQSNQLGLQQKIQQLADSQDSLSEAQRMAALGNWRWDVSSETVNWSDEMWRVLNVAEGDRRKPSLRKFLRTIAPRERDPVIGEIRALGLAQRNFSGEHRLRIDDKSERILFHQGASEVDEQGTIIRIHGTIQDITERKRAEDQIRHLALYDSLTGLPNRQFFKESLEHAVARAKRGKESLATLFIDLDRFKRVNDTLGHAAGDELLQEAAQRLRNCVRQSDFVGREMNQPQRVIARLGGDEFTISLVDLHHPQDAAKVATRILKSLEQPFLIGGQELNVTASIGIAVYPDDGQDSETLLKHADVAMYQAKAAGKNAYMFFANEMNAAALEKLQLENDLKRAVERDQFVLYFQPKIDIELGCICGVEALIRWQHPQRGLMPPSTFIGIAEEIGMIVPIGQWVLRTACSQLKKWRDMNFSNISMAINLAAPSFRSDELAIEVDTVLKEFGLPPELLEMEVTESMFMEHVDRTMATFNQLREIGVKLSIDDFGTGHSSLSYLRRFHIDQLKIDRSFITNIAENRDDASITAAIISLGRSLGIQLVAEGVETQEQVDILSSQGCRFFQGFHFGKPVPSEQLVLQLTSKN